MKDKITSKITRHIGVISESSRGWRLELKRYQPRRQEKSAESVQMEVKHYPRYPDAAGILRRCAELQNALQVVQKSPPYRQSERGLDGV